MDRSNPAKLKGISGDFRYHINRLNKVTTGWYRQDSRIFIQPGDRKILWISTKITGDEYRVLQRQ